MALPPAVTQLLGRLCGQTPTLLQGTASDDAFAYPPPVKPGRECLDRLSPLYQLLPLRLLLDVLRHTGRYSRRQYSLPAHDVLWLVIAQSLFRDRSIPKVWRHLHSYSGRPEPDDTTFTYACQRLGVEPLSLLFRCLAAPLGLPGLAGCFHRHWRVLAMDGSVLEVPDTPENRAHFGSSCNQHKAAAFPQIQTLLFCEVGTHAFIDVEFGPYEVSELALSETLLPRLPKGVLLVVDRGLSYCEQVILTRRRDSHVLGRVKAEQRALPVEEALADGSYLSSIYPCSNDRRADKGAIPVRVVRYTHDDAGRDSCGEQTCLITTVLDPKELTAREAIRLYPWRWEEESALKEFKESLLRGKKPLFRSKTPLQVKQEFYGALLAHFLVRWVMAAAAQVAEVEAWRLSFKSSLEVLEDHMMEKPGQADSVWLERLVEEVGRQELADKQPRSYPRVVKAPRCKWPGKKPEDSQRKHAKPFSEVCRLITPNP